jgi:hypothetical protein
MAKRQDFCLTINCTAYLGLDPEEITPGQPDWGRFNDEMNRICLKLDRFYELLCSYIVYGFEIGAHGNYHVQAYCEMKRTISFDDFQHEFHVVTGLPKPHLEQRHKDQQHAANYCKKDGMFFEHGEIRQGARPGKRLEAIKVLQEKGYSRMVVEELDLIHCLNRNYAIDCENKSIGKSRRNDPDVECCWWFGEPGAGKSYAAEGWMIEMAGENYNFKQGDRKYFVEYDSRNKGVFLDNVTLHFHELEDFIGAAGKAPFGVEIKGGGFHCHAQFVAVTSVGSPVDLWNALEEKEKKGHNLNEILRRITHLYHCVLGIDGRIINEVRKDFSSLEHIDLNDPAMEYLQSPSD